MADPLTLEESSALRTFLEEEKHPLYRALRKFCQYKRETHEQECASLMTSVPRQYERASDHAAKAESFREFMSELRFFAEK